MIEAYKKFWTNFFNFKGRSTRSDYWYVVLANFIIGFIIGVFVGLVPKLAFLSTLYAIATFIPSLAVAVRRYHDVNKSGWNHLWLFVPIIGYIVVLVYLCSASVNENNKYGERV